MPIMTGLSGNEIYCLGLKKFAPGELVVGNSVHSLGFLGGLVMSAIKRDQGVKDWGDMISGHGGILDRMDSIIFSAPVFFHVTRYWWGL